VTLNVLRHKANTKLLNKGTEYYCPKINYEKKNPTLKYMGRKRDHKYR
jgi:hypothetical protein